MIAYDETYLSGAQKRLGAFLDFAASGLGLNLTDAHAAFLASPLSRRFAAGDPAVVAGRSGEELALDILGSGESSEAGVTDVIRTRKPREIPSATSWVPHESASPEYWTGWALAFYQWASGYAFEAIDERVCIDDIRSLYTPYHEMDVRQFCDRLDELCSKAHPQTNLQARRLVAGLSQRQLSRASGVPVRTLQQYEQGQKDIGKARAEYIIALASVLNTEPSKLIHHRLSSD